MKYFCYFSQDTGFDILCRLSPMDNLHEMSNPNLLENKQNIINLSSAKYSQRVVKVKETMLLLKIGFKLRKLSFPSSSYNTYKRNRLPIGVLHKVGQIFTLRVNTPLGVNLMHINRALI